jgi:anaerobic magnesium-protoporphyrin IX monomethyl ester cyclase
MKQSIDALFVNPPSPDGHVYIRDINRSGRRSRERTIWPQTSLAYLAAVLKEEGYSVDVVDCIALNMTWTGLKAMMEKISPRFVVTNAITSIISNDLYTTYLGKFLGAHTIAIGPHVTSLPVETLKTFPSLDFGIMGEAEITIKELCLALDRGTPVRNVKGIACRTGRGEVEITAKRPFIDDLDELPIPLHELLPISKHRLPYIGTSYTFVLTSRGCPYQCTFCRQPIMWERKVRKRSAQSIFKELAYLNGIGVNNIMFHSDTFTIDRNIVVELCDKIIEEKLPVRWICNSRVDTVDHDMLVKMKKAGCWMIAYGIETGSDMILKNVKKGGYHTVEQARKAVAWTKDAGISVWAYFIMGLPGENKDTVEETIALAKSIPADIVNFAVGAPYPGTELYTQAKEHGWLESECWEDFDQNYSAILSYPDFSSDDVMKSIRRAYLKWYLRPRGVVAFLKGVGSWNDLKTLVGIGLEHLKISKTDG